MTKDELQKEAYEWTEKNISVGISMYNPSIEMYCGKAYKDGAEPREKRIEELIALINAERKRQEKCDDVHLRTIAELEKENAELKKLLKEWLQTSKASGCDNINIVTDTEQFLNEVVK